MKYTELIQHYPNLHEIVAVSKTFNCDAIQTVFNNGFRHFGENKVQELLNKQDCNNEIIWHFIGHLQSNKVKDVSKIATWIDSVDSIKLLSLINKECIKLNKTMNVLIQVKFTNEETKSGINPDQVNELIDYAHSLSNITCRGFMIIGPNTDDVNEIRNVFNQAKLLFDETHKKYPEITELSMGMSSDYKIAYEEGSTIFRLGSILFGRR
jgi:pyridoxal phosphate enzyme (YggS family)